MSKDLLFYSNFDEYSKEIITLLTKKNMRSHFLLICIDQNRYNIPPIIKKVPTLLIKKNGQVSIATDNDIMDYIDHIAKQLFKEQEDLNTFAWEKNSYSENFASLGELDNEGLLGGGNVTNKSYTFINDSYPAKNNGPTKFKDDEDIPKQQRFDVNIYDSYLASRNEDEKNIKRILKSDTYDRL